MFKVNCHVILVFLLLTVKIYFSNTPFSSVFIPDFEQVNVSWGKTEYQILFFTQCVRGPLRVCE